LLIVSNFLLRTIVRAIAINDSDVADLFQSKAMPLATHPNARIATSAAGNAGHWMLALAAGPWPLVVGCWLLAAGHWSVAGSG